MIVVVDCGHDFSVDVVQSDDLADDVLQESLEGLSAVGVEGILLLDVVVAINDRKMAVEVSSGELAGEERGVVTQRVVGVSLPRVRGGVRVGTFKVIEELSQAVRADGSERKERLNLGTFVERVGESKVVVDRLRVVVVDDFLPSGGLHHGVSSQIFGFLKLVLLVENELVFSGLLELFSETNVSLSCSDTEHH